MDEKICPLMSRHVVSSMNVYAPEVSTVSFEPVNCQKGNCALWIGAYTTEKEFIGCCAFEMMALKNSKGQYRV